MVHLVGTTRQPFLEQTESKVSVISWHSGKFPRVARSSNAAELQVAADTEGELIFVSSVFLENLRRYITLKKWQDVAAQVPATLVLDSRGENDALPRSESSCLGLKGKRSSLETLALRKSLVDDVGYVGHIRKHNQQTV